MRNNLANTLKLAGGVLRGIITSGFAIFNLISLLLITPVVAFYMLRDWDMFIAKVDSLLPRRSKASIREQARQIDRTLAGFIRGQLSVCVILGTYYSLGLYLVGLDLGLLVGFIAGLISFIPYVGSIVGFLLSIGIAFAQFDSLMPILQVVLVFVTGQFLEGNFLTPKLVGENVGLHPVWVMFALLAGGVLLGFLGLMIAVPLAAVIGVLLRHAIENYKKALFIWTVKTMRRLISFILLIAVFWGGWQLFLYQARPQKEAVVTIGATLPLSGTNAETGLAAQDALNLALKEWNSRQNRYRYRIFYLDDSGKAEQAQKIFLLCWKNKTPQP